MNIQIIKHVKINGKLTPIPPKCIDNDTKRECMNNYSSKCTNCIIHSGDLSMLNNFQSRQD